MATKESTATSNEQLLCSFDTCEIAEAEVERLMTEGDSEGKTYTKEEAEEIAYSEGYIYEWEWDYVHETLTEYMGDNTYWKVEGRNMGWRNLSGYKYFTASSGREMLSAILPETDLTLYVWKVGKNLKMKVSHHDSPTGEFYEVMPLSEKEYEKHA
jgi:hypothetical protein